MEDFRPCWCVAHRGDGSKGGCASNCRPQPSLWPDAVRGGWRDQRRSLHRTRHTPNPIRGIGMPGAKGLCYQYHEAGVKVWNCNLDQWTWDKPLKPLAWQVMASICKYASGWGKWWETDRNGWIFGLTNVKLQSYIELPNFWTTPISRSFPSPKTTTLFFLQQMLACHRFLTSKQSR